MHKLNTKNIYHTDACISRDGIYDDCIEWRLDTSCDWCPLNGHCPYYNIDQLNEKRSCFVYMGDTGTNRFRVFLLKNNVRSLINLNCFYIGKCYVK